MLIVILVTTITMNDIKDSITSSYILFNHHGSILHVSLIIILQFVFSVMQYNNIIPSSHIISYAHKNSYVIKLYSNIFIYAIILCTVSSVIMFLNMSIGNIILSCLNGYITFTILGFVLDYFNKNNTNSYTRLIEKVSNNIILIDKEDNLSMIYYDNHKWLNTF